MGSDESSFGRDRRICVQTDKIGGTGAAVQESKKFLGTSYDKVNMLNKLDVDEDKFRNEYFSQPFNVSSGGISILLQASSTPTLVQVQPFPTTR